MTDKIPTKEENPKGLHQKYLIKKLAGFTIPDSILKSGKPIYKNVDKGSEYFVLRLDMGGKDLNHVRACRIGVHAYADAIKATIPQLAKDLKQRYPLIP